MRYPGGEDCLTSSSYDPDDYYVDLETSSSFSKHFNDICVITLGRMTGTTFPVMTSKGEQQPLVAGAQVSTNPEVISDTSDSSVLSKQSTKNRVTLPYVIFNLSLDAHIYIPKGTIITCPNCNEPKVDVIEAAETIKEAQETMQ